MKPVESEFKERSMGGEDHILRGVIRNGAIALDQPVPFPEGTCVTVTIHPMAPDREAEVAELSEEAVREVDQWERQE
jgi:hypothetical protein